MEESFEEKFLFHPTCLKRYEAEGYIIPVNVATFHIGDVHIFHLQFLIANKKFYRTM